jgi:hypothetical protein
VNCRSRSSDRPARQARADDVSIGWAIVGRIYEGSRFVFSRRTIEDTWLPAEVIFEPADGRCSPQVPAERRHATPTIGGRRVDEIHAGFGFVSMTGLVRTSMNVLRFR